MSAPKIALLLIDPYNDFLHPDGKLTSRVQESLTHNDAIKHMQQAVGVARAHGFPIFYGLHQQWKPGFYEQWYHMTGNNMRQSQIHFFAEGSWGAEIYDGLQPSFENKDVVVSKHWNSNAFWNTDMEHQLRQRDITHVVLAGMTANTCLESTGRAASECGFHLTMLKDATGAFSVQLEEVAKNLTYDLFSNEVLTVDEWESSLKSHERL